MATSSAGRVIVISGPSGVGKTTVVKQLYPRCPRLRPSVSATTRPPRPDEVDGRDYHFLSPEEFARRRAAGEFLECCEVFGSGYWYGTLWSEVTSGLSAGKWVVLEIDVQGALAVLARFPEAVTIFIRPESTEELERRLRGRGTESEDAVRQRLEVARHELAFADRYKHQIVNRSVDQAVADILAILNSLSDCPSDNRQLIGVPTTMIDELREEQIVNKVGGRFKLSTLIQKRLVAINAGSRPLVDMQTDNKLELVIQEIMQDKIYLDSSANLRITGEHDEGGGLPDLDLTNL